ncbi:iron-sulfur cluster assembly scaffold protein [Sulfuriroseicoccus oceanibius]|uniref:Iron-sulfur cluster assembly scaffold protein n=1 Tax=Sulfuriroseicoccus oceanibius TaxID=2707525 RepID=A0A6B3L9Y1_9BACT|nr:iron-sulfur cluster assembly scaffold protein [Sulfuriroseicoccus oceanibius]QQL44430.1 iron-sulfur cluster assembly scaffold protein [Sulfuriroseicoccus oceanibius]
MDEKKLNDAIANPQNLGEMADADSVGTVGSPDCGDMVRMWLKFKEEDGRKVIDRASFQSFGCQTAIAVASMATEMLKGKTVDEARQLKAEEMTGDIGALPPMKIHCGQLVEGALKSALDNDGTEAPAPAPESPATNAPTLADSLRSQPATGKGKIRIVKLTDDNDQ